MGFCNLAAPTFLREWKSNEWVSQMCPGYIEYYTPNTGDVAME